MAGLDLGGVHTIVNGSERVQPATLRRFAERFAPFNFTPRRYGPRTGWRRRRCTWRPAKRVNHRHVHFESEELTAGHAKRSATGDGTPLVSYGVRSRRPVRIVDPETAPSIRRERSARSGCTATTSPAAIGRKPEETERTFGATLVDPSAGTPEGPWLRTGDLGFFSEGELFIVGRIKDLLIVYGRNHSPDDIEATIQEITRAAARR